MNFISVLSVNIIAGWELTVPSLHSFMSGSSFVSVATMLSTSSWNSALLLLIELQFKFNKQRELMVFSVLLFFYWTGCDHKFDGRDMVNKTFIVLVEVWWLNIQIWESTPLTDDIRVAGRWLEKLNRKVWQSTFQTMPWSTAMVSDHIMIVINTHALCMIPYITCHIEDHQSFSLPYCIRRMEI